MVRPVALLHHCQDDNGGMFAFDNCEDWQITMELKVSVNGLQGLGDGRFAALLSKTGKDSERGVLTKWTSSSTKLSTKSRLP